MEFMQINLTQYIGSIVLLAFVFAGLLSVVFVCGFLRNMKS